MRPMRSHARHALNLGFGLLRRRADPKVKEAVDIATDVQAYGDSPVITEGAVTARYPHHK